jgi:hypothetical protein
LILSGSFTLTVQNGSILITPTPGSTLSGYDTSKAEAPPPPVAPASQGDSGSKPSSSDLPAAAPLPTPPTPSATGGAQPKPATESIKQPEQRKGRTPNELNRPEVPDDPSDTVKKQ